jgi:adenylate cyclase
MSEKKERAQVRARETRERMQNKNRKVLTIGLGITFGIALLTALGAFTSVEKRSLDQRFRWRGERPLTAPVAVVAIDDETMNGWVDANNTPQYMPERFPFPRDFHGQLVRNLKEAGAKLIVFDIVFSESSKRDPTQDSKFGDAMREAGNVIMAQRVVTKSDQQEDTQQKTETLIPVLNAVKLDIGNVATEPDEQGHVRTFVPLSPDSSHHPDPDQPNIDLAVYRQWKYGKAVKPVYDPKRMAVVLGDAVIPLNSDGTTDVNYAGGVGTVPTYPYHDVFYKTMDMSAFKDKIVYVGSSSTILHDNWGDPYDTGREIMPGVEAHAEFLDTIVTGLYLRHSPAGWEYLLILVLGLLASFLTFRVSALQGLVVAVAMVVVYGASVVALFITQGLVLPFVAPLLSVIFSFGGLATYRGVVEERRARTTRQMFSRYVSKQIVEEIMKNPDAVALGGELKEVTILFSDVRGFTAMSEKLSAPQVVEVLNEYLTAMVDIVMAHNGTLDKYVGDAIMAVWGSPLYEPKHKENALRTAVQMMEVLQELQAKWQAEGKPHIDIGIGLNTGHVVAGNMGHPDFKMDYTVIGDDVNLAARMESANKEMKSHILITGSSYEGCEHLVDVIKHEPIHVKGKEASIEVYEVIGWKGQGRAPWAKPLP